jgi:hypothetical protein
MNRFFAFPAFALILSLTSSLDAEPAESSASPAKQVWDRHVAAAMSGDLDAVIADFGEDAVVITPDGALSGDAIRQFFEAFLADFTPDAKKSVVVNGETVHGNVIVSTFTIGAWKKTFHDTAVIEDDKLAVLSTVAYPAE